MIEFLQDHLDNFEAKVLLEESVYAWAVLKPAPKQSTSFAGHAYVTPAKVTYMKELAKQLSANVVGTRCKGPVSVIVIYCFPWRKIDDKIKKMFWDLMDKRPDIDNLTKPLFDVFNKILLSDDSAIVDLRARKIRFQVPCLAVKVSAVRPNYLHQSGGFSS